MKIKSFIIILYTIAGLLVSILTAFMTFIIIGEPIGSKMFLQIVFAIILVLPMIGLISYIFGKYLSSKFHLIENRLESIKKEDFSLENGKNIIYEINQINQNMNFLSIKLDTLINDLKQKNNNLSNLLISMAHDIKTPITILNGYIDEIDDGMICDKKLPSVLTHMKDEVRFLDELTIDMLEFITSMQKHKIKSAINLFDLIQKEIFTLLPKNENAKYINDVDKNFTIEFSKIDLKKICINILFNAIKYTSKGYIRVYNKDEIIVFENNGQIIEDIYKNKIFEPFFTIDKSKNRKKSGFGLGLSIVKNLSQNNNYDCFLESSDRKKTLFYLTPDPTYRIESDKVKRNREYET